MKANIRGGSTGKGPFHGHKLRLTIGLIVKNEEKTLDKCLSALSRLRAEVPSELIITDTGSTDRTVEIARKYTENIIHFKWCDDFAAARNTGIDAAKGEWFLVLDADEWLDDPEELIRFFNSGDCDKYWTCSFLVRNYSDLRGKNYNDYHGCRIFRMHPGIHYQNKVHEDISIVPPTKMLEHTFVHHYGYVFRSADDWNKKVRRNLALLQKEMEESPEDLKAYAQLSGQYLDTNENEKEIFYAEQGLKLAEKQPPSARNLEFTLHLFQAHFNLEHYSWVVDEMGRAVEGGNIRDVFHLEELWYAQTAAFRLKQYPKVLEYGDLYLDIYEDNQAGKLDKTLLMYSLFLRTSKPAREDCLITRTRAFLAMDNVEEALKTFECLDLSGESFISNGSMPLCFDLACKTKDFSLIADYFRACLSAGEQNGEELFANFSEMYQKAHPVDAEEIRRTLAETDLGSYAKLCGLRDAKARGDSVRIRELLAWFEQTKDKLRLYQGDVLYDAMTEGRNVMPLLLKMDADDLPMFAGQAAQSHSDFADVVEKYAGLYSFQNAMGLRWIVCAMERALLLAAEDDEPQRCLKLFEGYIRQYIKLIRATYLPEALATPSLAALPRPVRFACLVNSAFAARNRGDGAAYLAGLRAALKEYPAMEKPVQFLLDRFETERKEQEKKAEEFAQLAKQVKTNIEALISRGEMIKAGQITAQLAALMPNDEDVRRYQKLTHTEPTMREIASRLPQ